MATAQIKSKPRVRVPAMMNAPSKSAISIAPAGARLMNYFGAGAQVAMMPGGMMLAVQADHSLETVRLADIADARG